MKWEWVWKHSITLASFYFELHPLENNFKRLSYNETQAFVPNSVTRLGDLLDFGQLFKAFGNN